MSTLLIAEHDNKALKDATAKALTAAKALGQDVHVLVAGKDCRTVADAATKLDGVKNVLLADGASYEHMLAEPMAALIQSLAGYTEDNPLLLSQIFQNYPNCTIYWVCCREVTQRDASPVLVNSPGSYLSQPKTEDAA